MKSRDEITRMAEQYAGDMVQKDAGKPLAASLVKALLRIGFQEGYEKGAKDEQLRFKVSCVDEALADQRMRDQAWNAAIKAAAGVAEEVAIRLAQSGAKAEQAGRERVASHRYSDSEAVDAVMIAIRALAKKEGEK